MTIVYCINIANRRSTVHDQVRKSRTYRDPNYISESNHWMRRREKRVCQILREESGGCDIRTLAYNSIDQSQKQTQEKDMWNPKAQFANQKMIIKYTAPKT